MVTLPVLSYYKYKYGLENLKVAGYLDINYPISMAIAKKNYFLYQTVNKTLASIPKNTFKIINDKWTTFKVVNKVDYRFIVNIILFFSIIILIIALSYYKLRKLHQEINELNRTLESRVQEEIHRT